MATETITLLFTDLVGSTELLSRVGEVRADELRREHFGLLRGAIDEAGGREVKNLGDGLMVAFDGASGALTSAVAMQQAVSGRPAGAEPLAIRIGVAVGEVEVDDDDYFGLPVVEAARLCATAAGGEILVTEFVRMLARSRSDIELESMGALELKGLDEPVETYRVRWVPRSAADIAAVPVPRRVASAASGTLVGRVRERHALDAALKDAERGDRRAVLIGGEPGIGKTTLTSTFACDAAERSASVLYGRCDEDLFVPYQPWVEALGHLVEHASAELLEQHVAAVGPALARLVPTLASRLSISTPEGRDDDADRHAMFGAVVDLIARAGDIAPLVVVLDDLHWADAPTVQLLRHVLRSDTPMRLMLLGTFRDSEIGQGHVLADALAALHRESGVERIALRGLGDDELLALLETVAGHAMTDDGVAFRDALAMETAGNPFFVGEMLRHLAETGTIYQDGDGRWVSDSDLRTAGLPVSIREVVGGRVLRLGGDTVRALSMASVIGRDFDLALLERVVDIDADTLVDLCDRAIEAAVLRETDVPERYTFAHTLIEHALYEELSATRRARSHRAVAEALEELCGDRVDDRIGELAYHWGQATRPQDAAKAVEYSLRAGDRALTKLAPAEALRWYREALAMLDPSALTDRVGFEARLGEGEAQKLVHDPGFRETLISVGRDALAHGQHDLAVRATLASSRGSGSIIGEVDADRTDLARAALAVVGPGDSSDRALLLAMLAGELIWGPAEEERSAAAEEALAIAERLGDPATFITVVFNTSEALSTPENLSRLRTSSAEACALADATTDPVLRFRAHWAASGAAADLGDREGIEHHVPMVEAAARASGFGWYRQQAALHRNLLATLDGDPSVIAENAARIEQIGTETGQPDGAQLAAGIVVGQSYMVGALDALLPSVEQARADIPGLPVYDAVLAWTAAYAGATERAAEVLTEDSGDRPSGRHWLMASALWSEAAWIVGATEHAAARCAELEPWPDLMPQVITGFGLAVPFYAALARATFGDLDLAVEHLERANRKHRSIRAPFMIVRTDSVLARVLLDRGTDADLERAHGLAVPALAVAQERGYGYVETDARLVINQIG